MDHSARKTLLEKLAQLGDEKSISALQKEADKIAAALASETRYDALENNIELLDSFAYRTYEKAFSIVEATLTRLEKIELTYEEVPGLREEEIKQFQNRATLIVRLLETLKHIRYHLPDKNLKLFLQYSNHEDEDVRKEAESCLAAIAGFDMNIFYGDGKEWRGLGPQPQEKVLAYLEALTPADRKKYFGGIISLAENLLSPSIGGTTWSYKAVTWRTGAVPALPEIKEIRRKTIQLLGDMYALAGSTREKRIVTSTLNSATRTSHAGEYGDDVWQMILDNTLCILGIYKQIVASETDMEVIQHIEQMTYWLHHNRDNEAIRKAALEIKDLIDQKQEYQIFKVLIGYEGVFGEWRARSKTQEDEEKVWESDYRRKEEIRNERMKTFAESINGKNFTEWEERILRYSKIESEDLATFPFFARFLEHFGKKSPNLALTLLEQHADELLGFCTFIFWGVWETERRNELRQKLIDWIDAGKFLVEAARLFEFRKGLDIDLLYRILAKTKELPSRKAAILPLRQIIAAVASNYNHSRKDLLNSLFLDSVAELTARGDGNGLLYIWFRKELGTMVQDMEEPVVDAILNNLLLTNRLDYQAEQILSAIATRFPKKVIEFFGARSKSKAEDELGSEYEAIPFQLPELRKPLSKIPDEAVDIVSEWNDGNYGLFIYRGAKLLSSIFPDFPEPFERKLIELVKSADEEKIFVVLAVLRNYEGEPALHRVCKEIVKTLPEDSDELKEVFVILSSTGVVSGEYGFVNAYERKKEEVKDWLNDQDEKVRAFAAKYRDDLDKEIEWERKRADEDIALRKFRYGTNEDN